MSQQPPDPGAPSSGPGRRSRRLFVAVAVAAVLVAAAVVVLVLTRSGEDSQAEVDASAACDVLEGLPSDITTKRLDLDEPELFELQGIGSLAQAAGKGDAAYEDMGQAGEDLFASITMLDSDQLGESLDDLRSECEDVD